MPLSAGEGDNARSGTIFVGPSAGIPRAYNFANDILGRYREAGHLYKLAYIDPRGNLTYGHLGGRIEQFAIGLESLSQPEERVLMCLLDTIDWPTVFLGSLYAGRVAVPVNTMLTEDDYRLIMTDCRPAVLVVSEALYPKFGKRSRRCHRRA